MKVILQLVLALQASLAGWLLGVSYTLVSGVAEGQGLAAGAILIVNAGIGLLLALIASIWTMRSGALPLKKGNLGLLLANVLLITALLVYRS
ncbi:hypothetical protein [Phaeodactylibacter luteus]|uniref:Uncharacterized protein n=1 Tax=Phaeodactylibacter luteus TaxID=1564516 RepID=A0A5C6S7C7_9BACT|nr:hypothetical protein [Phaeodactylibacter luteus]TXB69554.1 hypothetical protein FRY97_01720 [Phaeodactylibacter luteus]